MYELLSRDFAWHLRSDLRRDEDGAPRTRRITALASLLAAAVAVVILRLLGTSADGAGLVGLALGASVWLVLRRRQRARAAEVAAFVRGDELVLVPDAGPAHAVRLDTPSLDRVLAGDVSGLSLDAAHDVAALRAVAARIASSTDSAESFRRHVVRARRAIDPHGS